MAEPAMPWWPSIKMRGRGERGAESSLEWSLGLVAVMEIVLVILSTVLNHNRTRDRNEIKTQCRIYGCTVYSFRHGKRSDAVSGLLVCHGNIMLESRNAL